jgi:hypothetical protein
VESDLRLDEAQVDFSDVHSLSFRDELRDLQSIALRSTRTDPRHSFLAFVLAKAAAFDFSASLDSGLGRIDRDGTVPEILFPSAKRTISAVL